jgi:hypothetical protein
MGSGPARLPMMTLPAAPGGAPPDQFAPFVQSLLTVPTQFCAAADPTDKTESAATDALIRESRCILAQPRRV